MEVKTRVRARVSRARGVRVRGARESGLVVTPAVRVRFRALVSTVRPYWYAEAWRPKIKKTYRTKRSLRDESVASLLLSKTTGKYRIKKGASGVGVVVTLQTFCYRRGMVQRYTGRTRSPHREPQKLTIRSP